MGFFSDLKEDLSQAVNEIKPDKEIAEEIIALESKTSGSRSSRLFSTEPEESLEIEDLDKDDYNDFLDRMEIKSEPDPVEKEEVVETFVAEEEPVVEEEEEEEIAPTPSIEPVKPTMYEIPTPAPIPAPTPAPAIAPVPFVSNAYVEPIASSRIASDEVSVIMDSMIINGNMATEGSLELRGSVVGNVECLGKLNITGSVQGNSTAAEVFADGAKISGEIKSMGSIKIGQSTTIIGNVFATSAVVAGAIKGDIDVKGPVILDSTAIVLGNIKSKAVQINNGAVIEGMVSQCYAEVNPKSFFEELKKMK